jgi:glycosyltransferase involved in cell wall biosynthesis
MKILLIIHGYPPTYYAGSERAAERIAQWLVAYGHTVHVFTLEKLDATDLHMESQTEAGVTIHRLYYNQKQGSDPFRNSYDDPRIGEALDSVLQNDTFDIAHVVSGYLLGGQVIDTAKAHGLPVVLTLTEFWFMCFRLNLLTSTNEMCIGPESDEKCMRCRLEEKRRYRKLKPFVPDLGMDAFWSVFRHSPVAQQETAVMTHRRETLSKALQAVDLVISPSRFLISKFAEYGYDTQQFVHLRHGLKPPPKTFAHVPSAGPLRLGYVGQIKSHKGPDLIIDAVLPLLDEGAALTLQLWGSNAGAGNYPAQLEEKTQGYPAIQWQGSYASEQLWDVLGNFDALIVPSRWYENSPTVILEAFMIGLPVITTNLGGMAELVEHDKNGLLFELNNADDLRTQIERLLNEPDLLAQVRAGIPPVPTIDDEIGAIYAHYERLIKVTE